MRIGDGTRSKTSAAFAAIASWRTPESDGPIRRSTSAGTTRRRDTPRLSWRPRVEPIMTTTTNLETMSGADIVALCRKHTFFEWSAQGSVDPIPMARARGVYFWTPEGKRYLDFN